ncbi:unnamed protein product [Paramecium primaurelia]|uniref:EF-hand domain-containing protein n=1 Tax=Paramecium primaurelia TaxID=5886 RepID=A0A8S1L085_PARPR|nr:unnamed protein product [Paramecium primaurelia]
MNNLLKRFEPSLTDVIKYLHEHQDMILVERNPYQADRLMMMLDNEKLDALDKEFHEHPNGIELPNFIWLMKCAISHAPEDKYELVNGLIKLFQDIDINGDGHMEWAEFTQYIIDAVIGSKDAQLYDTRFEKERELTEIEVLDRAYSRKSKRYIPMAQVDDSNHKNPIKNIAYCQQLDSVICLEQNSQHLRFYTPECQDKKFTLAPESESGKIFIIHFHTVDNYIAAVTSDRQLIFWDATTFKVIKQFKQEVLQTGIWYFPYHELWVTAGSDYNIRGWSIPWNEKDSKGQVIKFLNAHTKQITDIVELISPKLLASASQDGKIKLWDMQDQKFITELKTPAPSKRGVKGLSYNQDYGSNLISYGFETFINVYCPEVSITRAYIGRLEGHSSLVVTCKFIPQSPNCVSIDDHTNIRIWDIRQMSSVQVIPNDQQSLVTDLCIITRTDRFVYSGKRLNYFYNAAQMSSNQKQKGPNEEVYPIYVEFNMYFNQFIVLTKFDLRIYDAMGGKLKKVMNEVFDDKIQLDLSTFCFGGRQRKLFIADNAGLIRQYNMKTGEFLKKVNMHNEIENSEFANKLANIKKRDTLDISSIIFLQEEKLLISASQDSTIRIYDETDPEESILLKVFCGGHQNSEILSMSYSSNFTMLATGSANGLISLWDFETSKLCGVLNTPQPLAEVTALEFADPYPVLVSLQGILISIWNIKTNKCLLRINTNPLSPMLSVAIFSDISSGPSRQELLPEFAGPLVDKTAQDKKSKLNLQEEQEGLMKDIQQYDTEQHQNKRRALLYMGDQKGYMHILSLTEFLQRKGITEMEKLKKGHSYQLKRKDLIDVSKSVETFLVQEEKQQSPVLTCNISALLIRQWVAHSSAIVKINKIRELVSFISSSMDKHFKIWSMKGELWSDISLAKYDGSNYWKFPFDWVGQKLKDIELVFDALKLIEKENLSPYEKERVKVRFLVNKYFNEAALEEMQRNYAQPEQVVVQREKKRLIQSQSQPMNIALKSIAEPYKELTQKMKDDQLKKKKLELPEVLEEPKRPQSQHGLVQRLMLAFNDNKDIAKEDGIDQKKKQPNKNAHQKRIQELPQMKPSTSHSTFLQKYQRNYRFIQTQVQTRPHTESKKYKFVHDIKYQFGESQRAMKIKYYQNSLKFQSVSPQLLCDDNEILQMKCKFYKKQNEDLIESESSDKSYEEDDLGHPKQHKQIIASHNFLNNAQKNDHKVLNTKKKIFVV